MNSLSFASQLVITAVTIFALTLLLAAWGVGRYIRFAKGRIEDVPNARSSHTRATPRGGGLVVVLLVLAVLAFLGARDAASPAWVLFGGGLFMAAIGFIDDLKTLSSIVRLIAQLAAAALAVSLLGAFTTFEIPFVGLWSPSTEIAVVLSLFWIVGLTNVYNFMDGIDGIAGGQAVVTGLAYAALGWLAGHDLWLVLGLAVVGSSLGFLWHNWSPAKVFMGDVGSAFLGYLFAVLPLAAPAGSDFLRPGILPAFAALAVWPFLADGILTFIRRALKRENVLAAHRSHLYQRLQKSGWPHARVTGIYIGWALLSAGLAFAALYVAPIWLGWLVFVALLTLADAFWLVHYRESQAAAAPSAA